MVAPLELVKASDKPSMSVAPPAAAAWNVGATPAPFEVKICPAVPTAVAPIAPVPLPNKIPLAAKVPAPVPPCATVRAVVSPVSEVMSEFAPRAAAPREVSAAPALVALVPPLAIGSVPEISVVSTTAPRVISCPLIVK